MPVSADDVVWAYRTFLQREPESAEVVADHCRQHSDWRQLVQCCLESPEFLGVMTKECTNSGSDIFNLAAIQTLVNDFSAKTLHQQIGYFIDFQGLKYDVSFFPVDRQGQSGTVQTVADLFRRIYLLPQVVGLLKSVQVAGATYQMISLGAGMGEWALKAKKAWEHRNKQGLFKAYCIEADEGHADMIRANIGNNFADESDIEVLHAAIAAEDGYARFPKLLRPTEDWGAFVVSVASSPDSLDANMADLPPEFFAHRQHAAKTDSLEWVTVRAIGLPAMLRQIGIVDYIHSDLQGMELELFPQSISALNETVKIVDIETHSVEADSALVETFAADGWTLQYRRAWGGPEQADGTFIWTNPRLYRE